MNIVGRSFREVWAVDFEFTARSGERPIPICLVARELQTGRILRLWGNELHQLDAPPYGLGADCLFVAYYASAEMGCHLALDWPLPKNVLDLFTEFRNLTNGIPTVSGAGLLGAMVHFGLDAIGTVDKTEMRDLAMRGGPYTSEEQQALLDYCQSDVQALARLLPRMMPHLDLPRALLRGAYMAAAANIEHRGVPIDTETLSALRFHWGDIQARLIERIDADYRVFDGRTFKADRWAVWLAANDIAWPRLPSGRLALDDDTFREMARAHPVVAPIRELRVSLSQMRLQNSAVRVFRAM